MKYTNINILDDQRRFKYILEYQDNAEFTSSANLAYVNHTIGDDLRVDFFESKLDESGLPIPLYIRNDNYWLEYDKESLDKVILKDEESVYIEPTHDQLIPERYNVSSVNLYFPTNSVESFTNNGLYMLVINTWIHGHIVYLGAHLLNRKDTIACKKQRIFMNSRYYEYINVKFIDPWYLTYSDDWKAFRQQICGEQVEDNDELNNTGSVLNFTLYPVTWNEDKYIKLDPYIGGQNAINISDTVSDFIGCDIEIINNRKFEKSVLASIRFNKEYNTDGIQTFNDLKLYLKETYDIQEDIILNYNLLVTDKDDIYKIVTKNNVKDIQCEFTRDEIAFDDWSGWKEGLKFILNVSIMTTTKDDSDDYVEDDSDDYVEDVMLLRSNAISITQDVMKYFVGENPLNYINLTIVDMNNYTINAVNKIQKNIIQVERPSSSKANMIKPVYYKVHNLNNIIVHPAVTENICINLDAYKSTVSTFFIQIAGVNFVETARNNSGVIFKIVGANIDASVGEGTYYILNQDKELVTTGKYKFEV